MVANVPCMDAMLLIDKNYVVIGVGYQKCIFYHLMILLCEIYQ